jgi:hypothetical protein
LHHPANSNKCKSFIDYRTKIESFKEKRPRVTPSRQREFISTPAPWAPSSSQFSSKNYNSQYPQLPPTNLKERLDHFNFNPMSEIKDFMDIQDIRKTRALFKKMTEELKSTNCQATRIGIMLKYTTP